MENFNRVFENQELLAIVNECSEGVIPMSPHMTTEDKRKLSVEYGIYLMLVLGELIKDMPDGLDKNSLRIDFDTLAHIVRGLHRMGDEAWKH